jgi:hypothetical protein
MVQDKKNFSTNKKPMQNDLDKKAGVDSDRNADSSRTNKMKPSETRDKHAVSGKRDMNSRK